MTLLQGFAVSLASSVLTLAAAYLFYALWGRSRLEARLALLQGEVEASVKKGVLSAGEELLPELRRQVAGGFADVLEKSHAAGIAEGTAKIVTSSTDMVTGAISSLLGLGRK